MLMWTLVFLVVCSSENVKLPALKGNTNKNKMIFILMENGIFGEGSQIRTAINKLEDSYV